MSVNSKMKAIADEIRELSGTSDVMGLDAMASTLNTENTNFESNLTTQDSLITQIQTALQNKASASEPVLQEKTVTPNTSTQNVTPDSGYNGLSKVTVNAMPTATQATPSITINASGLITATATQTAGYVEAGTKSGTKQLTTQAAKTITPTKSSQTAVESNVYTTGTITVAAIPSQYITTTDATASADEIMSGETAYVNGSKVTGTFTIDSELSTQDSLITQIQTALEGKAVSSEPSGTLTVTENGMYDVKNYVSVNVNVDGSGGGSGDSNGEDTAIATCGLIITAGNIGGSRPNFYGTIYNDSTNKLENVKKTCKSTSTVNFSTEKFVKGSLLFFDAYKISAIDGEGITCLYVPSYEDLGAPGVCVINTDAPDVVTITLSEFL